MITKRMEFGISKDQQQPTKRGQSLEIFIKWAWLFWSVLILRVVKSIYDRKNLIYYKKKHCDLMR